MAKSASTFSRKPTRKKLRSIIKVTLALLAVFFLVRACNSQGNALDFLGFKVDNGSIVLNKQPDNLKGAQMYVKANLTMDEAKTLLKEFKQQKPSGVSFYDTPKDMPMLEGNTEWQARSVKKYWCGSFSKVDFLKSLWHCKYIFDVGQPNAVTLYVYGITFDD